MESLTPTLPIQPIHPPSPGSLNGVDIVRVSSVMCVSLPVHNCDVCICGHVCSRVYAVFGSLCSLCL